MTTYHYGIYHISSEMVWWTLSNSNAITPENAFSWKQIIS